LCELLIGLGMAFVPRDDFSADPAATVLLYKSLKANSHGLRAAGNNAIRDKPVEVGEQPIVEASNDLRHTESIA
jgi:hypothetical protein